MMNCYCQTVSKLYRQKRSYNFYSMHYSFVLKIRSENSAKARNYSLEPVASSRDEERVSNAYSFKFPICFFHVQAFLKLTSLEVFYQICIAFSANNFFHIVFCGSLSCLCFMLDFVGRFETV